MRRRLLWLALALTVAASAIVAAQDNQEDFLEERRTTCWPCHVAWDPPLRSMYNIILPDTDTVVGTDATPYPVRIQNPWLADIVYLEPSLDLSLAPSLGFAAQSPPVDEAFEGTIVVSPQNITGSHEDVQIVPVTAGATSLRLAATPGDSIRPPVLELAVWTGNRTGDPAYEAVAASAGAPAVLELDLAGLRTAGAGNWTVVVRTRTLGGPDAVFVATEVPYTLSQAMRFDVAGERIQFLTSRELIKPDGNARFQWLLVRTAPPTPDEAVVVRVNATAYWKHEPSSNAESDYGNFTKSVDVVVEDVDGAPMLPAPQEAAPPGPDVRVGVSLARISEAVGYISTFALVLSVWTGGIFGRASRRQLNVVFGSAKRRVVYHNFISYALTVLALAHLVLFVVETFYHWTLGIIWGGVAILAMVGLGVTGALQVPMIRRWNYGTWRWSHLLMAYATLVFTLVHLLLDGANFGAVQEAVGWGNPLDPRGVGAR